MEVLTRIMEQVQINSQALNQRNQWDLQRKNEGNWKPPSYKCQHCRDTGFTLTLQDNMAPLAKPCQCKDREKLKNQWSSAGINPEWSTQTFKNFVVWNESSKRVKETAAAYYMQFEHIRKSRKNSIMLCGQVGSGKTHASVALALNFLKKNIKVAYMPYRDVITNIKQNMLDYEIYKKLISKYQSCEVLLLDDLFKGKINDSDKNIIFEILNYRYLNFLPIIVSSEFTVDMLLDFDEGIGSRIYEMCKDYIVEVRKDKENNYRLR